MSHGAGITPVKDVSVFCGCNTSIPGAWQAGNPGLTPRSSRPTAETAPEYYTPRPS
jgi:hypothetical protein